MGTRLSLGRGFTLGRSGLRYGHFIPGVRRGYISVGRSGTLLTGFHLRHWESGRRRGAIPPAEQAKRAEHRAAIFTAAVFIAVIWGMFAVIERSDTDYARTHDSQGQPIRRAPAINCATDPHPEWYYACTPTPAAPDLTYRNPTHG